MAKVPYTIGLRHFFYEGLDGGIAVTAKRPTAKKFVFLRLTVICFQSRLTYMKNKKTFLVEKETFVFAFWGSLC